MSNIWTDFVRIYPLHGRIEPVEAEAILRRILGSYGSYHVPALLLIDQHGRYADLQYGGAKSPDIVDFLEDEAPGRYDVWGRRFDSGGDVDGLWHGAFDEARVCRYGFDEVRVSGGQTRPPLPGGPGWVQSGQEWRLAMTGAYSTGNCRTVLGAGFDGAVLRAPDTDAGPGGTVTPTTPAYEGRELFDLEPQGAQWLADEQLPSDVAAVELFWGGRLVHQAWPVTGWRKERPEWEHRGADWWDNCVDPEFVATHRERLEHHREVH